MAKECGFFECDLFASWVVLDKSVGNYTYTCDKHLAWGVRSQQQYCGCNRSTVQKAP